MPQNWRPGLGCPLARGAGSAGKSPASAVGILTNDADAAWRCRKVFNCTGACPRGIKVTRAIIEVQLALLTGGTESGVSPEVAGI